MPYGNSNKCVLLLVSYCWSPNKHLVKAEACSKFTVANFTQSQVSKSTAIIMC